MFHVSEAQLVHRQLLFPQDLPVPPGHIRQHLQRRHRGRFRLFFAGPKGLQTPLQPGLRLRQALHEPVELLDHPGHPGLSPGVCVPGQKLQHGRVLSLKGFLHHLVQGFLLKDLLLEILTNLEVRRHIRQVEIVPDHFQAEGIKGADIRLRQPVQLLLEGRHIRSVFFHGLRDIVADPLPKLRRRRVGKGHHQHLFDGDPFLHHELSDPLRQHRRFTGTRRRRHQNILIPRKDRPLLGLVPLHFVSPLAVFYHIEIEDGRLEMGE